MVEVAAAAMDEPMIISVVGNQDALWEANDFWEEEKVPPENKPSDIAMKADTTFFEDDIKLEQDAKVEHVKSEDPTPSNNTEILSNHEIDADNHRPQHEVIRQKDISIVDVAFVCGVCKNHFDSEELCKKHIAEEHEEKPVDEPPPPKPSLKSFRIRRDNDDLKRKATPITTVPEKSLRNNSYTPSQIRPVVNPVSNRTSSMTQVLCSTCGARFFHQKTLSRHMQNQHGILESLTAVTYTALLYACDFCGARFSRYRTMLDHYRSEHKTTEVAPIDMPCLTCDEMFKSFKQLEEHVTAKEHNLQWYCFLCEKQFNKDIDLRDHICPRSSSGDFVQDWKQSKLVCTICSKIYYGRKLFTKHISRCKVKETCKDCSEEFHRLKDWIRHKDDCADIQVIEVHPAKS